MTTQLGEKAASWPIQRKSLFSTTAVVKFAFILVFCTALVLAGAARLINLNEVGYNSDEAVYAGQGAAIAQVPVLSDFFPVFRAHPLMFQFILALIYPFGMNDLVGRLASAAFGVATVVLIYLLGSRLYDRTVGLYAALFLAVMPYHVIPTRQVLLDGPMAFFTTLTLLLMAMYGKTQRPAWLYAAGAGMGLTILTKETGIIMAGSIYAFLALTPALRVRVRDLILSIVIMVAIMAIYPMTTVLAGGGGGGTTQQYLIWQLFRRPNHVWSFYITVVPPAIGYIVIALALAGLWLLRGYRSWRETLLIVWILVPVSFFQLWPTKGFQYLLPIAAPMAVLAARALAHLPDHLNQRRPTLVPANLLGFLGAVIVVVSLAIPAYAGINRSGAQTSLAGSGGVPGGREMGHWIDENIPAGATFMTIGPSMANIIKYYGHRQAYGLSVSTNPLHRNPSYKPVENPDFSIRTSDLQYLVWDSFSAERTTFFSEKLMYYAEKYNGRVVHTQTVPVVTPAGEIIEKPVIVIYEVRP